MPEIIEQIIAKLANKEGNLLPILHSIQETFGYIDKDVVPQIADQLNLSRAEVHGVISFYHDFRSQPIGKNLLQICRAEACQAMGSRNLEQYVKNRLKLDYGETSADGEITLEPVYCLGNCACSPSIRINDQIYARVDSVKIDSLLNQLQQQKRLS